MTTPNPTPEQNLPATPNSEETRPDKTGFFNRVQRQLNPKPIRQTEEEEIVVMEEGDGDRTRS